MAAVILARSSRPLAKSAVTPGVSIWPGDTALTRSHAYATGQAALLVYDARAALAGADVIYAID